jgi:hypothetical protein
LADWDSWLEGLAIGPAGFSGADDAQARGGLERIEGAWQNFIAQGGTP